MDILSTLAELLPLKFIFFGTLWLVGIYTIGDYYGRQKRSDLLHYLQEQSIATARVDAYCRLSAQSAFSYRFDWEHVELYLTEEIIYYFGYHNFFGWRRMYNRNLQLCLPGTKPVTLSIEPRFHIVTFSKFANGVWEIHFSKETKSAFSSANELLLSSLSIESRDVILQFHNKLTALGS